MPKGKEPILIISGGPVGLTTALRLSQLGIRSTVIEKNKTIQSELRAPFGGYKNSGIGRDGGEWSRSLFTEEKTVSIPLKDFPIAKLGEGN